MSARSRSSQPPASRASSVKPDLGKASELDVSDGEETASQILDSESVIGDNASNNAAGSSSATPTIPIQKRRRVTRACDECRRKKIKCDGKQPCTHCQVYSYECTYDKPSNRRRNPAPQYIEALENRLSRAESLLRKFVPDVDLSDPTLDPSVQQEFRMREQARARAAVPKKEQSSTSIPDASLQSMIHTVGQLDLDERGDYDFHGNSSGSVFFKRMKEHFRALLGRDSQAPQIPKAPKPTGVLNLDSPRSAASSPWEPNPVADVYDLPPKGRALALCSQSLDNATCLLRIVHKPSFYEMLDNLYAKPGEAFGKDDNRNLALVYSVMALGSMYNVPDESARMEPPYKVAVQEALKYYGSARNLLQDITECRDITSLQALLFMILFIQSISNLSTCYGFVGIALRSALRMGLHRHLPHFQMNPLQDETRRRVFYICRQMDTYVSALLGFPLLLDDDDIDQELPTAVDDEYITKDGITLPPPGTPSFFEAFNAHVKLMGILKKVVKHVYPLKGIEQAENSGEGRPIASYNISYAKIKELEEELQQWNEQLPLAWRPNPDGPDEMVRVRNLLRFAFAHVQMVLYRPFLHYVSPRVSAGKEPNERAYACGAAGISVARNIVHLGSEMRKQVSLVGPYWFTLFSEFFAIIALVFFVLENQDKPGSAEMLADAIACREMIAELAKKSAVADRISSALDVLFDQLPDSLTQVKSRSMSSRKRPATASASSLATSTTSVFTAESSRRPSKATSNTGASSLKGKRPAGNSQQPSVSFDNVHLPNLEIGRSFSTGFDFSPIDLTAPSPDSLATTGMHDPSQLDLQHHGAAATMNPIHRLDAMMFPSDDPLAYPNQPRDDFGPQRPGLHTASPGGLSQQDPSQFYMPNLFDNIEGQLMGPLPPYLIQNPTQAAFTFPSAMYSDPMLPSQVPQGIQMPNIAQQQAAAAAAAQLQHNRRQALLAAQARRQRTTQRRDFEELVANTPWHGMFPQHGMD
ncbi:fungal-specific transcription factor domain-containing protein [Xylariomycetidae sp. FL2044]|nr:fungal-specific transcription factor domain-containing protein [Xylariomycetidae sp. FL2044]